MDSQENALDIEQKRKDYENVQTNLSQLADVRFKLLTFLPSISGLAIGIISFNIEAFRAQPLPRFFVGILGFIVTLGVVFYNKTNTEKQQIFRDKAIELEKALHPSSEDLTQAKLSDFETKQDKTLALIFGSALGAWLFPIFCGILWGIQHVIPDNCKFQCESTFCKDLNNVPVQAGFFAMIGILIIIKLLRLRNRTKTKD